MLNVREESKDSGKSQPFRENSGSRGDMFNDLRAEDKHGSAYTIRVGEMFAGIGGFRLGFERANNNREFLQKQKNESLQRSTNIKGRSSRFTCVWANEIDKYASQIYRRNFGDKELVEGDIRQVNPDTIPQLDLLVAGFPCQSFSLAGKRQGFRDIRGTMFFEIARIAKAKRPKMLFLENVKGLLSHDNGDTLEAIFRTLGKLDYDVEGQVFNSKHFGVPQNRERIFIVGHLRGAGTRPIFPVESAADGIAESCGSSQSEGQRVSTTVYTKSDRGDGTYIIEDRHCQTCICDLTDYVFNPDPEETDDHCETCTCNNPTLNGIINRFIKHKDKEWLKNKLGKLDLPKNNEKVVMLANRTAGGSAWRNEVPTLDNSSAIGVFNKSKIRRLTPVECERLQGFPDNWTNGVSDTQRYKCLGNAVTVNVIEYLGREILKSYYNRNTLT